MRWVSTRVFPEPAPATTSTGPSVARTASRCAGFRSARYCSGEVTAIESMVSAAVGVLARVRRDVTASLRVGASLWPSSTKERRDEIGGIAALLALAALAVVLGLTGGAGAGGKQAYEVWVVDQSNTNGTTSGGTLLVYDGASLERRGGAAVPERIDLGGAAAALCLERTGTAPVRPHMVFFNAGHSHAVLSFVASGHVVFFDARTRTPLECIDAGVQAHAAVPSPDGRYVVVTNQNGKLLQRISTDYDAGDVRPGGGCHARPGERDDAERGAPAGSAAAAGQRAHLRADRVHRRASRS